MALQFQKNSPKLNISELIGAPNLEHLELEFPSFLGLELPLQIAQAKHNKPFRLTLVAFLPKTLPLTLPLDWKTLEQGFGPQDYTKWRCTGSALHQPLVRESYRKQRSIYCNKAYTAAARARIPRLAAAPPICDFKLFREDWLCERCEECRKLHSIDHGWSDSESQASGISCSGINSD